MREQGGRIVLMDFGAGGDLETKRRRRADGGNAALSRAGDFRRPSGNRPERSLQPRRAALPAGDRRLSGRRGDAARSWRPPIATAASCGCAMRVRIFPTDSCTSSSGRSRRRRRTGSTARARWNRRWRAGWAESPLRMHRPAAAAAAAPAELRQSRLPPRYRRASALPLAIPALAVALIVMAAVALWIRRPATPPVAATPGAIRSVAVLPLQNIGAGDYFADGMTGGAHRRPQAAPA